MNETLVVSSRGQGHFARGVRKRLGIKTGDVLILEDRGSEIVLKPGVVIETQYYRDQESPNGTMPTGCRTGSVRILGKLSAKAKKGAVS